MRFSIVIPTCNRPETLAACLSRLAPGAQTGADANYEVIVTDDGDSTAAQMLVRDAFPWARWTRGPRRGPAANRNHGASLAHGEWLVFTDDDCLPDPGWLAAFAEAVPERDALEGRTVAPGPRSHPLDFSPINEHGGCFWACNIALRRTRFAAVGGFDERFPFAAMEDIDLRLRLQQAGLEPLFVPRACIVHPWRRVTDWEEHARRHLHSQIVLDDLHPGRGLLPWARLLRLDAGIVWREHIPFLRRRPREGSRLLWRFVCTMSREFAVSLRRRPFRPW
jgi:GT2 family glycosyltransferase